MGQKSFVWLPRTSRTAPPPSMQPLGTMTVTHLELEVLAWCGDQSAATQPEHDQDRQEETAEQDPSGQPGAPVPRTDIVRSAV